MAAFFMGHIMGLNDKQIITGFNGNLFFTLIGVTFLFSILNVNGTIELVAKRSVSMVGKHNWLIPIVMFLVGYILTAVGPGSIRLLAILPAFAIPVAIARGFNPLMMALIADFGAFAGRMSPITPEGLLVRELLATGGINDVARRKSQIICRVTHLGYYHDGDSLCYGYHRRISWY